MSEYEYYGVPSVSPGVVAVESPSPPAVSPPVPYDLALGAEPQAQAPPEEAVGRFIDYMV